MSMNINTDETQLIIRAGSFLLFGFKEDVNIGVLNFFPQHAGQENLEKIGRDRNAPRYINEDIDEYRDRVINAFDFNRGIGKAEDIIRAMRGLDYAFNSYTQGDTSGGTGSFNLLVHTTGGVQYDASEKYDANVKYELIQAGAPTPDQEAEIREQLKPIIRASSIVLSIVNIAP
jgi:hypothetical protein